MIEGLPFYVAATFLLTALATIWFVIGTVKIEAERFKAAKACLFLIPLFLLLQGYLSIIGFYLETDSLPPRLAAFGAIPALIFIIVLFIFARDFLEKFDLRTLTLLHVIRMPVELVLFWLFQNGKVPQIMTFEGRNFDILIGLSAPLIAWLAFRGGTNRVALLAWNVVGLIFLANIVGTAILSLPGPLQKLAFEQPNIAVLHFPFVWLPTIVVPIVLFAHAVSLWKLARRGH